MQFAVPSEQDIYLFREGTNANLHHFLGCHLLRVTGRRPFCRVGPQCSCRIRHRRLERLELGVPIPLAARADGSGIWEGDVARRAAGQAYKYRISPGDGAPVLEKADPVGFLCEAPPATASRAWALDYEWHDAEWLASRGRRNGLDAPMAIYEAHLGSWRRKDGAFLNYRELAHALAEYLNDLGIHAR